jgi:hypothetical protein
MNKHFRSLIIGMTVLAIPSRASGAKLRSRTSHTV